MLPILNIGPLSLPTPALLLLLGFWIGAVLAEKAAPRSDQDPAIVERLLWTGLAAGVIGARISFLVRFPSAFQGDWFSIFSLNPAFLDPASGSLVSLAAMVVIILKEKYNFRKLLDVFSIFITTFFIFFALSRFAGGTGLGIPTKLPWSVSAAGAERHPVQLYYALLGSIGLLLAIQAAPVLNLPPGRLASSLFSYLAGTLLFISRYQLSSAQPIAGFRSDQILYWLLLLAGMILYLQLDNRESLEVVDAA